MFVKNVNIRIKKFPNIVNERLTARQRFVKNLVRHDFAGGDVVAERKAARKVENIEGVNRKAVHENIVRVNNRRFGFGQPIRRRHFFLAVDAEAGDDKRFDLFHEKISNRTLIGLIRLIFTDKTLGANALNVYQKKSAQISPISVISVLFR